jgi:hypothetical protein
VVELVDGQAVGGDTALHAVFQMNTDMAMHHGS